MIARDVFVALAVQTRMIQCGKVSDRLDKFSTLQNIANLHGIEFTLDVAFKIYRDLTKSATFEFGFTCCICLNQGSFLFFGGVGGAGEASDLENWLTAKKKYPGYLPDFYHIFCNTNKTLILNAKNNSSSICLYPGFQRIFFSYRH